MYAQKCVIPSSSCSRTNRLESTEVTLRAVLCSSKLSSWGSPSWREPPSPRAASRRQAERGRLHTGLGGDRSERGLIVDSQYTVHDDYGRIVTPWIAHPAQFIGLNGAGGEMSTYETRPCFALMTASLPEARSDTKIVLPLTAMASGWSFARPGVGSSAREPRFATVSCVRSTKISSSLPGEEPYPTFSFGLMLKLCQSAAPSVPASESTSVAVSSR